MTAFLFGTGAPPGSGSRLSLVWRTGALALAILAISVAGQSSCTDCFRGTSGPCQQANKVCHQMKRGACPPGTAPCVPATGPDEMMDADSEDGDEVKANEDAGSEEGGDD